MCEHKMGKSVRIAGDDSPTPKASPPTGCTSATMPLIPSSYGVWPELRLWPQTVDFSYRNADPDFHYLHFFPVAKNALVCTDVLKTIFS